MLKYLEQLNKIYDFNSEVQYHYIMASTDGSTNKKKQSDILLLSTMNSKSVRNHYT